jgi:hypothetical protein
MLGFFQRNTRSLLPFAMLSLPTHFKGPFMWIKLTGEYLNLRHIVRVKVTKAFKNGQEEWVVELEGVNKGELTYFTRYRGIDAEVVLHALEIYARLDPHPASAGAGVGAPHQATTSTVHDVKIL